MHWALIGSHTNTFTFWVGRYAVIKISEEKKITVGVGQKCFFLLTISWQLGYGCQKIVWNTRKKYLLHTFYYYMNSLSKFYCGQRDMLNKIMHHKCTLHSKTTIFLPCRLYYAKPSQNSPRKWPHFSECTVTSGRAKALSM